MSTRARDEGTSAGWQFDPVGGGEMAIEPTSIGANQAKYLRALARKKGIRSTESLVEACNAATVEAERCILLEWLTQYQAAFVRHEGSICREVFFEYVELTKVKPRAEDDESFLKTLTVGLGKRILQGEFPHTDLAEALHRALLWIHPGVFRDTSPLVFLVDKLLDCLSSMPRLTKENFAEHESTFLALHQSIVLLRRVARRKVAKEEKQRFRRALATKRQAMQGSLKHYPVRFHLNLIEQGIERLEVGEPRSSFGEVLHCVACSFCGVLHMFHGLRAIAAVDVDPTSLEEGFRRIQNALGDLGAPKRRWYDLIQAFNQARVQMVQDSKKLTMFEDSFEVMIKTQATMRSGDDRKAMRFGIINEVLELAMNGIAQDGRFWATEKLVDLGNRLAVAEAWSKDADVFEALLVAVHCVHVRGESVHATSNALREMAALEEANAKHATKEWLGKETIEGRLSASRAQRIEAKSTRLFRATGKEYGVVPADQALANIEDMRSKYQDEGFATVRSLFDNEQSTHVKDMRYEIIVYEERELKEPHEQHLTEEEEESGPICEDHVSMHHGRKQRERISIDIDDLFKPRRTTPDKPHTEIRKVLMFGDPGTGKTCISKTIGHGWATKTLMRDFKCVFVLPVRELNESKYKDQSYESHGPLEAAVADLCFTHRSGVEREHLLTQISDEVDEETTLLVFDGLDEADKNAKGIVEQGKKRGCKVLMLSRPYNIQTERAFVDVEVECVGLSGALLKRYILGELLESGERLVCHLKSNPSLCEIARVPITAHILCSLWKAEEKKMKDGMTETGLSALYFEMAMFVWERYRARPGMIQALRNDVFESLEAIALEAFEEGQILIEQKLVAKHSKAHDLKVILKDSGFLLLRIEGAEYQFPHLTFQEFFAGRGLAHSICGNDEGARTHAMEVVAKMKYLEKSKVTLSFMAEEISKMRGFSGYGLLLPSIDRGPIEVIGVQHLFLKLRTLDAFLSANKSVIEQAVKDEQALHLVASLIEVLCCSNIGSGLWEIAIDRAKEIPYVIRSFSNILDTLMERERLEKWIDYDAEEVASIVRHKQHHWQSFLEVVQSRSENDDLNVRWKAMEAIGGLAAVAPEMARDLVAMLEGGLTNGDKNVREKAVAAIGRLVAAAPENADDLVATLERGFTYYNSEVRVSAIEAIEKLAAAAPEKAEDVVGALERGLTTGDWNVREKAMEAIGRLAATASVKAVDLVAALGRKSTDRDPLVRLYAMERIGRFAVAAPDKAGDLVVALERGSADRDPLVRREAMEVIGSLVEAAPDKAGELVEALKRGSTDGERNVRERAVKAIGRLAAAAPDKMGGLLEALDRGSTERDSLVRRAAMEAIGRLAEAAPAKVGNFVTALKRGSTDGQKFVRGCAMGAIGRLATGAPEKAVDLVMVLERGSTDRNSFVRQMALEAIGRLALAAPEKARDLLAALERGSTNGHWNVRVKAMEAVGRLAATAPENVGDLVATLERGSTDNNSFVRREAIQAIGRLVSVAPEIAGKLVLALERGSTDHDLNVCVNAMKAIGALAAAATEKAEGLMDALEKGSTHEDKFVRLAARKSRNALSLHTMLRSLELSNPCMVACEVGRRLMEVASTLNLSADDNRLELVSHSFLPTMLYKASCDAMHRILADVKDALDEEFPGLYDILEGVRKTE